MENPWVWTRKTRLAALTALVVGMAGAPILPAQDFTGLEEVIVTASKRVETLQEAGMAITALTTRELEQMGVQTYADFAVRVPNLGTAYQADGRFDANSPTIRGVFGGGDTSSAATTGFYIDDVPVSVALQPRVIDLERIETLRGPQGSLYGARSMGGTIRLITQQPSLEETYGSVRSSISTVKDGDYNYAVDGSFNAPISDSFAVRVAGYYGANSGIYDRVHDPIWVNLVTEEQVRGTTPAFGDNENVDDEDYWGGQVFARWMVTDRLSISPKFMYQKIEADGLPLADMEADSVKTPRFFDSGEPGEDEWWVASLVLNYEMDSGEIVSTTANYERDTHEQEEEHTFLNHLYGARLNIPIRPLESTVITTSEYENFSHETRFASSFEGPWNFTAGVFYADNQYVRGYPPALQPGVNDALKKKAGDMKNRVPGDLIYKTNQAEDVEEIAVFGEVTWEVNDWLSLTAGGRWYDTEVEFAAASDGFAISESVSYGGDQSESGFNPRLLAEVQVGEDINIYASAAKGFRIGGVNGVVPATLCGDDLTELNITSGDVPQSYDSDSLWSYEVGFKSTLADNRLSINAAGFFIDWADTLQLIRLSCGFQFTLNADEAESKGLEVEINAALADGLNMALGVGYTDAEITDAGTVPGLEDGTEIQGVPEWTATATVEYIFPFFDTWEGRVRADGNYYGDSISRNNGESRDRDSWQALNLRAGMTNDSWDITLFADNVTDERANLSDSRSIAAETSGRPRIVTNRPRTFGVEARYRF